MNAPSFTVSSAAKINLALHIIGQRADGYHLLNSLVIFTDIGDRLHIAPSPVDDFRIEGDFGAGLPLDDANLVVKARKALGDRYSDLHRLCMTLEKNLPVASGIGGGSGNAAAALRAFQTLHPDIDPAHVDEIALALGADVPMCLDQRAAIASGIGEVLSPVDGLPELHLVMVNPGIAVSTPAVYRALTSKTNTPLAHLPALLTLDSFIGWLAAQRNDLQIPALHIAPGIAAVLDMLEDSGALLVRMSGSGATCFGLFASSEKAVAAAGTIAALQPDWWVRAARSVQPEPLQPKPEPVLHPQLRKTNPIEPSITSMKSETAP